MIAKHRQRGFAAEPGRRKRHRAHLIGPNGEVSALCFATPRPIDMRPSSKETWTTDDRAVTCPKCKAAIAARKAATP